jgi:hypothetical protein
VPRTRRLLLGLAAAFVLGVALGAGVGWLVGREQGRGELYWQVIELRGEVDSIGRIGR